ncbi:ATP-binding cassette domain-containing protein [bacterium]|nr:MAG: ATP-binding cassette domain-containing protein [bacterium]
MNPTPLLEVHKLSKVFPVKGGALGKIVGGVRAVDSVSFNVQRGEVFGLVGESGCGKTTMGRMLLRLIEPSGGSVVFDGEEITALDRKQLRPFRRRMQMVFQDPFGSLNPRKTVGSIVGEPLKIAGTSSGETASEVEELLRTVGLPEASFGRYPHEFSGGQRQRIGVARSLILRPEFLLADEPVSALDVSIQAQILNLLMELKDHFSLTMLFISHDLRVIRSLCDRVAVMYLGRLVEVGPVEKVYANPVHPYTEALIQSIPEPDPKRRNKGHGPEGEIPSPSSPPPGCHFHTRCPLRIDRCFEEVPELSEREEGRRAACHVR